MSASIPKRAGSSSVVGPVERAAQPCLHRACGIDQAFLDGPAHDAPVEDLLPEVLVPEVVVRVELDEPERPVHRRQRPQLRQQDGVIAAEAERRDPGSRDLLDGRPRALERLDRIAGHGRRVAPVDDRQPLRDVTRRIGL